MQKRTGLRNLLSYKQGTSQSSNERQTPTSTTLPISKYYSSINELPLNLFWKICDSEEKDKSPLIISGEPDPVELDAAWHNISIEYADIMSADISKRFREDKKAEYLRYKLANVSTCIHILKTAMPYETTLEQEANLQAICDQLTTLIPSIKLDYHKREMLIPMLDRAEGLAKKWMVDIDQHNSKREKESSEAGKQPKPTMVQYQKMLNNVVLWHKMHHLNPKEITVLAFALYYRDMADAIERQKTEHGRARSN